MTRVTYHRLPSNRITSTTTFWYCCVTSESGMNRNASTSTTVAAVPARIVSARLMR